MISVCLLCVFDVCDVLCAVPVVHLHLSMFMVNTHSVMVNTHSPLHLCGFQFPFPKTVQECDLVAWDVQFMFTRCVL